MQTPNLCLLVAIHALVTIVISKLTNMSIQGYMTIAISISTVNLDVNYAITETCEVNTENE